MARWPIVTAQAVPPLKTMVAAASTVSAMRAASSTSKVTSPHSRSTSGVIWPIGSCQGLASPNWPRMVTITRPATPQLRHNDSMFTQLPTPLDCMSTALRPPPSQAPAARATPSSSVLSGTSVIAGSVRQQAIRALSPASGT